jgi:hypothetical protein
MKVRFGIAWIVSIVIAVSLSKGYYSPENAVEIKENLFFGSAQEYARAAERVFNNESLVDVVDVMVVDYRGQEHPMPSAARISEVMNVSARLTTYQVEQLLASFALGTIQGANAEIRAYALDHIVRIEAGCNRARSILAKHVNRESDDALRARIQSFLAAEDGKGDILK